MDKVLEGVGDIFKALFSVSPATGVLFLVCVVLCFVVRHLYTKLTEAQTSALLKADEYDRRLREAQQELRLEYEVKLKNKECDIDALHERATEREQTNAKILDGLRVAISRGNVKPFLQSLWNGVAELGKFHGIDVQAMRMLEHMVTQNFDSTNP